MVYLFSASLHSARQGDRSAGEPGKVREFDIGQGNCGLPVVCYCSSNGHKITNLSTVNTVTARDVLDALGIMQLADKPAYYSSYIATIFSVV